MKRKYVPLYRTMPNWQEAEKRFEDDRSVWVYVFEDKAHEQSLWHSVMVFESWIPILEEYWRESLSLDAFTKETRSWNHIPKDIEPCEEEIRIIRSRLIRRWSGDDMRMPREVSEKLDRTRNVLCALQDGHIGGAIIGDMVGSPYEFHPLKGHYNDFPLFNDKSNFTDDSVLTCAVAVGIMKGYNNPELTRESIIDAFHLYGPRYPNSGYGNSFIRWLAARRREPYNSLGNGSAMRVSPVAWAYDTLEDVERYAAISAEVTHNHPEGIKGACAVAGSIFLARTGKRDYDGKYAIARYVRDKYGYAINRDFEEVKRECRFDETCPVSVPEAIIAFLYGDSYEDTIRKAVYLGGDADTQAAIAGSIAEAFYKGVPNDIILQAAPLLDDCIGEILVDWSYWLESTPRKPFEEDDEE